MKAGWWGRHQQTGLGSAKRGETQSNRLRLSWDTLSSAPHPISAHPHRWSHKHQHPFNPSAAALRAGKQTWMGFAFPLWSLPVPTCVSPDPLHPRFGGFRPIFSLHVEPGVELERNAKVGAVVMEGRCAPPAKRRGRDSCC